MRASESKRQRDTEEINPTRAFANWKELTKKALACIFTFPALLWRLVQPSLPRLLAQLAQWGPAQAAMSKMTAKDLEGISRTAATMAHQKGLQETQETQFEEFMRYKMAEQGKPFGGHSGARGSGSRSSWEASGISSSWSEVQENNDNDPEGPVGWGSVNYPKAAIPKKAPAPFRSAEPPKMSKDEELRNEMRKSCTHSKITKLGSNPFVTILTCKFCGLELSRTRTPLGIEFDEKKAKEKEIKSGIVNEKEKDKKPQPFHRAKYGMTPSEHSDWTEQFNQWHDTLRRGDNQEKRRTEKAEEWVPAMHPAPKQNRSRAPPRRGTAPSDSD